VEKQRPHAHAGLIGLDQMVITDATQKIIPPPPFSFMSIYFFLVIFVFTVSYISFEMIYHAGTYLNCEKVQKVACIVHMHVTECMYNLCRKCWDTYPER
jgi:hypothetical protein